ncbi:VOC family protein [Dictyobacter aurantiacus]|uniref:Glyoxalase/fosfomycin resistance/dioxygenase domain-containing protein n=1 Tax=Dictyobacter aurantiacus TaxID=1936993 RepID=A0A401ZME9_9CHLR|nr:VOC family protein [Dictyobacter aurantiacus]GCE08033.1 hypothetical protein KDAU_53620 [Dictyobacter aurantiacus]
MADLPSFAMRVSDVASSCSFLVEMLGFTLTEQRSDLDIAYLLDSDGDTILLAGPAAHDLSPYLNAQHYIVRPGEIIGMGGSDLEARQADLRDKGVKDVQLTTPMSTLRRSGRFGAHMGNNCPMPPYLLPRANSPTDVSW